MAQEPKIGEVEVTQFMKTAIILIAISGRGRERPLSPSLLPISLGSDMAKVTMSALPRDGPIFVRNVMLETHDVVLQTCMYSL
ncbi:hypothetical protein AX14_009743 [Amanita brunnescens Koide BX004]|nr:hypothetical protein AX14_009743 [Amanita brunnescens Koide BX004]